MMPFTQPSYDKAPAIVIWETTRACALACKHCRAEAIPFRNQQELSTTEAFRLMDSVAEFGKPMLVFTGGDPFMRDDLAKIVEYASFLGLRTAVSPSATGRLKLSSLQALAMAGCRRISLSIDAPDAASHDAFRGVTGSFARTMSGISAAREAGLEVQINTTISHFNHRRIAEFADLMRTLDIVLWSVFFVIPLGRAGASDVLSAQETEAAFGDLLAAAETLPFRVKTTEAPHYRRFVAQHAPQLAKGVPEIGISDGKGFIFVSHVGDIYPSGFLPHTLGNVRTNSLLEVYRNNPFIKRLRDPGSFKGKCGVCEFNKLCGGSRARAYAMTGNAFESEPTCSYVPQGYTVTPAGSAPTEKVRITR